jgi:hypothetical protein
MAENHDYPKIFIRNLPFRIQKSAQMLSGNATSQTYGQRLLPQLGVPQ